MKLPEIITKKIELALKSIDYNRYPDALAKDLCENFSKLIGVKAENVVAGNGSDELISLLFVGFLLKGETYASFQHDFSMYNFYGSLSECTGITIEKNSDLQINIDNCIKICQNNNVKLLIFSNPCNPTSLGITANEVCKIIESLPDTLVVADEAYMDFWGESVIQKINEYDNLLVLKTCSKAFGMAGIRTGFAVGNKKLIDAIKAIKSPYNMNSYSQTIASIVLNHKDELNTAINEILLSKENLLNELKSLSLKYKDFNVLKSKTNFIVVLTSKSKDIFDYLSKKGISIRCFKDYLRITAGTLEENQILINEINKYFIERT